MTREASERMILRRSIWNSEVPGGILPLTWLAAMECSSPWSSKRLLEASAPTISIPGC